MRDVVVAGTGIVRFGLKGRSLEDMVLDAGLGALGEAGVEFDEVGSVHTGFLFLPITTGVRVAKEFGLTGVPVERVENASATGSATFRAAYLAVAGGRCEVAMGIGFEGGARGLKMDLSRDSLEGNILPAAFFGMWANRRMHEWGTTRETLAAIAAKNWNHARSCPWAQRHADHEVTAEEVLASRVIADPHTSMMSAAVGSGAAAVVVMSADYARRKSLPAPHVRVLASEMQTERYTPGHVFLGPVVGPERMTTDTARAAYETAGIGPSDLDLFQVHDAFPIEELLYYELLDLCGEGEGDKLVASGDTQLGGRIPCSTDGGLIGRGHPGGPTGLAQIHETFVQLKGRAGSRQVDRARVGLCHMVGAGSSCVVSILGTRGVTW